MGKLLKKQNGRLTRKELIATAAQLSIYREMFHDLAREAGAILRENDRLKCVNEELREQIKLRDKIRHRRFRLVAVGRPLGRLE